MTSTTEETRSVRLRLISETQPPTLHEGEPTIFGLQDKQQAVDSGRRCRDGSVEYECVVKVRRGQGDRLRFSGPCVHGTAADPFLYLSWRRGTEPLEWIRRLKISLASITWEQAVAASAEDSLLEGRVAGTGAARVSLLGDGWTVRSRQTP